MEFGPLGGHSLAKVQLFPRGFNPCDKGDLTDHLLDVSRVRKFPNRLNRPVSDVHAASLAEMELLSSNGRFGAHEATSLRFGFTRSLVIDGDIAFFDPERQIVISDTHRGNLILMDDGRLAPIDLRVQPLSGSLLDTVTQLCSTH